MARLVGPSRAWYALCVFGQWQAVARRRGAIYLYDPAGGPGATGCGVCGSRTWRQLHSVILGFTSFAKPRHISGPDWTYPFTGDAGQTWGHFQCVTSITLSFACAGVHIDHLSKMHRGRGTDVRVERQPLPKLWSAPSSSRALSQKQQRWGATASRCTVAEIQFCFWCQNLFVTKTDLGYEFI